MRISIWGGTGYAGRHIAAEAAKRGHDVVVFSRTPGEQIDGVTYETGSILDSAARARSLEADIVVSALSPRGDMADKMRPAVQELISEATSKGVRIAVVGGAGSLLDEPGGTRLVDSAADAGPELVHVDWTRPITERGEVREQLFALYERAVFGY